jgi:hypothetical protein
VARSDQPALFKFAPLTLGVSAKHAVSTVQSSELFLIYASDFFAVPRARKAHTARTPICNESIFAKSLRKFHNLLTKRYTNKLQFI